MKKPTMASNNRAQQGWKRVADAPSWDFTIDEAKFRYLFTGYFNNKMTVLLFLTQRRKGAPSVELIGKMRNLLNDLYYHMLEERSQKRYRLAFKWLMLFLKKLPDVNRRQRNKARKLIRVLYHAFGVNLNTEI